MSLNVLQSGFSNAVDTMNLYALIIEIIIFTFNDIERKFFALSYEIKINLSGQIFFEI